jgi:hypothetical protein
VKPDELNGELLRMKVKLWRVDLLSGILRLGAGDRRGEEQV